MTTRKETDSMGAVEVPADRYWGAQTQRSLEHFKIAGERFPPEMIRAFGLLKRATAEVNAELGLLPKDLARAIVQAAPPLTLGQEISGWVAMLDQSLRAIHATLPALYELPIGGTAVGTGLNAPAGYGELVSARLAALTGLPFASAPNKFQGLASHEALVFASGALKTLATSLTKIANDVRWLASGPRAGLGELRIPASEPV